MTTIESGSAAEKAVADYLTNQGFKVIELNWRNRIAEIDIVAEKDKVRYFVEVKYRGSDFAGDGFDYITTQKLHHMSRAAEAWVLANNYDGPYELLAAAVTDAPEGFVIDVREIL